MPSWLQDRAKNNEERIINAKWQNKSREGQLQLQLQLQQQHLKVICPIMV